MLNLFKNKSSDNINSGSIEYIIAGLGNPGKEYELTRHNAGFLALDLIAEKCGVKINKLKYKSLCVDTTIGGKRVLLMKPQTYMNLSGESIRDAASFYKIPVDNIIVLYDDISLDPGKLRIRRKGTDGGHNGIKSIIYQLSKDHFPRIKIGVGAKPHPNYNLADWVLSKFTKQELEDLKPCLENCYNSVELMVNGKTDEAMNKYNS